MTQLLGVTDYINSLDEVDTQFHLSRNDDQAFFLSGQIIFQK